MRTLRRVVCLMALTLAVAGCSTAPPEAVKAEDLPKAFTAPKALGSPQQGPSAWWRAYSSPELTTLIQEARVGNLDLAAAAARVEQAQAQTGIAVSALLPNVTLNGSASRQGSKAPGSTFNTFGASLGASYELDFWGLAQDNLRAARSSARAALYGEDVVRLTTDAGVASTYFAVLALRERIAIAKRNVEAAKRIFAVTKARVVDGLSSTLDLAQQNALLAGQEAQIPMLEEQEREMRYALAILLGRAPEGFDVSGRSIEGLSATPITPGLPSSLLERRPDIAQAEATLLAAHANLDAARAAFLPAFGLTGSGGYAAEAVKDLINPSNLAWDLGASLMQTIFDGGKLSSQRDLAAAQEKEMVADYKKTVLSALSDVEAELGSSASLLDQERLTTKQVASADEAFRISEVQYREGVIDLLTLLQAQQALFSSQDQLVQIKLARLQADVGLYRALGRGWTVATDANRAARNDFMPLPY